MKDSAKCVHSSNFTGSFYMPCLCPCPRVSAGKSGASYLCYKCRIKIKLFPFFVLGLILKIRSLHMEYVWYLYLDGLYLEPEGLFFQLFYNCATCYTCLQHINQHEDHLRLNSVLYCKSTWSLETMVNFKKTDYTQQSRKCLLAANHTVPYVTMSRFVKKIEDIAYLSLST